MSSECVQSVFRVCSECVQSVFRVCSILKSFHHLAHLVCQFLAFFTIKTILLKVVVLEESALDAVEAATDAVIGKSLFNKDYFELTSGI